MAATIDLTKGGTSKISIAADGGMFILKYSLNFSETGRTAADTLQLFNIPAKTLVTHMQYDVITAEGGTFTFDLGDGADPDGFIDGANGNSVGNGVNTLTLVEAAPPTILGYGLGKYYSATDTLDILINDTVDTGVMVVRAICIDLSS